MTYEEHIARAEQLLAGIRDSAGLLSRTTPEDIAEAQVHATLAVAKKPAPAAEAEEPREPWHAFLTGRWAR